LQWRVQDLPWLGQEREKTRIRVALCHKGHALRDQMTTSRLHFLIFLPPPNSAKLRTKPLTHRPLVTFQILTLATQPPALVKLTFCGGLPSVQVSALLYDHARTH
jgi:hypothetical protein